MGIIQDLTNFIGTLKKIADMVIYEQGGVSWHHFYIKLSNVGLGILLDEDPGKHMYDPYSDRKTPTLIIDLVKRNVKN
jgi:hypothetical protein